MKLELLRILCNSKYDEITNDNLQNAKTDLVDKWKSSSGRDHPNWSVIHPGSLWLLGDGKQPNFFIQITIHNYSDSQVFRDLFISYCVSSLQQTKWIHSLIHQLLSSLIDWEPSMWLFCSSKWIQKFFLCSSGKVQKLRDSYRHILLSAIIYWYYVK